MFLTISLDPLLLIIFNLTDIQDVINLSNTNKDILKIFDDDLYLYWGRNLYTKEFWEKARQRTPSLSNPFLSMKMELLRIDNFQKHLLKYGYQTWNNADFFIYWEGLERGRGVSRSEQTLKSNNMRDLRVSHTNDEIYAALNLL